MEQFQEIEMKQLNESACKIIGTDWMLVTAGTKEKVNTMTASWGGLGVMWGKDVAYIVIRPQRYTKEFIDRNERLSLTFYEDKYKEKLAYCGRVSGREENKIEKAGLHLAYEGETPYFTEARLVLCVRKMYAQPMEAEYFLDKEADEKWYQDKDYHTLYICEIEKAFIKK